MGKPISLLGLLTEAGLLKGTCITEAQPIVADNSPKLELQSFVA